MAASTACAITNLIPSTPSSSMFSRQNLRPQRLKVSFPIKHPRSSILASATPEKKDDSSNSDKKSSMGTMWQSLDQMLEETMSNEVKIRFDMPSKVSMEDDALVINGIRMLLPGDCDRRKVKTELSEGVLLVTIPKSTAERAMLIGIVKRVLRYFYPLFFGFLYK